MVHELNKQMGPEQKSKQESQASSPHLFPEGKGFIAPSNATQWFRAVRNPQLPLKQQGEFSWDVARHHGCCLPLPIKKYNVS